MDFLLLEQVDSTNSYVSLHAASLADMTMVIADAQTAGRGQRGNSWESEPGKNLTFTLLHRPKGVLPREQFAISEATALAVADFLEENGFIATVKWPNDIYVGDRKIAGILIEHSLTGSAITDSRIGVGLNVNQQEFRSDAPNPVSMRQLTGHDYDISRTAARVGAHLERRLTMASTPEGRETLHAEFRNRLWRGDGGAYPFRRRGEEVIFHGVITGVSPEGPLSVRDTATGETSEFMFKEVEFVL